MSRRRASHPEGFTHQPTTLQARLRNRLLTGTLQPLGSHVVWTKRAGTWRNCVVCWTAITPDQIEVLSDCVPPCHISCVPLWQAESEWWRARQVSL